MSDQNNTFTLDAIRAAADKKYASTIIPISETETVTLVNVMRLSKDKRDALLATQKRLGALKDESGEVDADAAAEVDQAVLLEDCIRIVAAGDKGQVLVDAIGGDLAVLAEVFATYTRSTELGEASPSADS